MNSKKHTYKIHLEPEPDGGFTVTVPALPGCVTYGEDYEQALEKAQECIEGFLETLIADSPGLSAKNPNHGSQTIDITRVGRSYT